MPTAYQNAHPLRHLIHHAFRSCGFQYLYNLLQQGKLQNRSGRSAECSRQENMGLLQPVLLLLLL